ncbi:unnamed protein product [Urochloa decumbens]|uniref:NB-ARC domain-containing protein n=1 Tax=Urochloa decumbens TaxID=240449 RepID=A0ABC9GD45_9POAL
MAAFLNAIKGDIANRVVGFVIDKCSELTTLLTLPTTEGTRLHDLQRLLLQVRVIIEEAEGRYIINPVMAYQLNILRKEMYRGYFILDSLRSLGPEELTAKDHDVSTSFTLSKFNPAKRLSFSAGNTSMEKDLQQVLDNLNSIMDNMGEFITILNNYPPIYRQPYSMHLYIGKCMFGRHMEMDRVIDFLMQIDNPSVKAIDVLPIVGPKYVGKSTLVAHVYNDERVRNHFSRIVVISGDEIDNESLTTLKDRGVIAHQDNALGKNDRLLAIIEFSRDVDEVIWNSFYSSACAFLGSNSKMVITSKSNKIMKFGSTQALVLNFLPQEAYWYFFKILTFGSVDSNDYPKLEKFAMEIARGMKGSFIGANIHSLVLKKNFVAKHWCKVLEGLKNNIQKNISLFGENPYILSRKDKPAAWIIDKDKFVVYSQHRECIAEDNVPAIITRDDFVSRSVKCEGEIEVLLWRSHILPFKSYVVTCTMSQNYPFNYVNG